MSNIAIYSRKSRLDAKSESIKNQIEMCKDYVSKSYENTVFSIFEDEGYSGGNIDRPDFHKMMKEIKNGHIDVVVCYRLDRISRSVSDFSGILEILNDNDTAFISVKEHFDTSTPIGRAMMYISSVFAQLERETIAERIRDNMRKLARTGRWLGGMTPTGFSYEKIEYIDENLNKKKMCKLVPDNEELKLVKMIYAKYLELGSQTGIITYTLQNNIKTRNGADFCLRALKNILTNPVYVISDRNVYQYYSDMGCDIVNDVSEFNGNGLLLTNRFEQSKNKMSLKDQNEWVIAVGAHKGIINAEDFVKIQKLLKVNSTKAPRSNSSTIALASSLIVCPKCGSKMIVSHRGYSGQNQPKHYYYKCRLKGDSNGSLCNAGNINGKDADKVIIEETKKFSDLKKSEFLAELKKQYKIDTNTIDICIDKRTVLENERDELNSRIQTLTLQLSENSNSSASKYIITQIETFDNRLSEIKKELLSIQENIEDISINNLNADMVFEKINYFTNNVDCMSFQEKKDYIRELVEKIDITGGQFHIKLRL